MRFRLSPVSALLAAAAAQILIALALIALTGPAEAKTVCRVYHNHQVCREEAVPLPPKPDPRGQQRK